jgi:HAD superfamily hydrolase (TIGR01450 family)
MEQSAPMREWLKDICAVAIDLDGVVYRGSHLIPGADSAIARLRELNLAVFFVTNNSSRTRHQIAEKLSGLGIPASEREVFNSGHAAAILLERLSRNAQATAFVIGSEDLKGTVKDLGVKTVERPPADFLIVGLDPHITYEKISKALDAVLAGAVFIACNRDNNYPAEGGRLLPGCGAIVAAVEAASGHPPDHLAGKPETLLLELAAQIGNLTPEQILVVGDSLPSDIEMAQRFGSPSILVAEAWNFAAKETRDFSTITIKSLAELPEVFLEKALHDSMLTKPEIIIA